MKNYIKISILILGSLLVGFLIGWKITANKNVNVNQAAAENKQIRNKAGYKFINPLYECEVAGIDLIKKYVPFENRIEERLLNEVQNRYDIELSLYFRNLDNGPWFGINENKDFAPASLLKVPLMIAYLKKSESNPDILSNTLTFNRQPDDIFNAMQQVPPEQLLENGKSYMIDDLIQRMIIYSDNESMVLLMNNFPPEELFKIYYDLGVRNPYENNKDDVLSVKDYASFFRILYNAAYLSKEKSEKALSILSQSNFRDGIVAGIPSNIVISHKFGEREVENGEHRMQFHDCGIVYYEKYPYLLCVMTRGNNLNELVNAIKDVSRITFEEIYRSYK